MRFTFPREVLLVEIERRCSGPGCGAKTRVGLTKQEALAYEGFECERCERWNEDALEERDVPDWWEELKITGLEGLRAREGEDAGPGEVVERLSEGWRRVRGGESEEDEGRASGDGE